MEEKKKFIKLGNEYYYIEANEKGLQLIKATETNVVDEIFEQIALVDPSKEVGNNFMQKVIDDTKAELEKTLKIGIKQTVLACLGFEKDSWGGQTSFRVDHCNGRMSEVTNHIKISLQDILKQTKVEDLQLTEKELEEVKNAYKTELLSAYKHHIRNHVWSNAEKMAKEDAKTIADKLVKERLESVSSMILNKLLNDK